MLAEVVIVTGAAQGIGYHMVRRLLEEGYRVAGLDVSDEGLTSLQSERPEAFRFHRCDMADESQVRAAVEAVLQQWGRADILVSTAAVAVFGPFEGRAIEQIRREFDVNYFGYVNAIRAVLPHMKARGRGIIHNVSSGVALTGFPGLSGYVSTKGAVEGLSRALSLESEPYGIAVTVMHPPLTNTRAARPLGVPPRAMADPADVGRRLAKRIQSTRAVITPGLGAACGLFLMRHCPTLMGKLLTRLACRSRQGASP